MIIIGRMDTRVQNRRRSLACGVSGCGDGIALMFEYDCGSNTGASDPEINCTLPALMHKIN